MSIKTLLLAGVLSLTAASAAFAMEGPPTGVGSGNGHASAAPACGYECPLLAGDGGPSDAGDNNGRSMASATARSRQVPALWRLLLASEEGLGSAGDQSGHGATGGRGGISGEV